MLRQRINSWCWALLLALGYIIYFIFYGFLESQGIFLSMKIVEVLGVPLALEGMALQRQRQADIALSSFDHLA